MKKPDKIQELYISLLCRALQLFYKNDAKALFDKPQARTKSDAGGKDGKSKIVNERAMVGCVYRYMWCMMQQQIFELPEFDVDIEYDRMIKDESGYYEKEISCKCESVNCSRRSNCIQVIVDEIQRRRKSGNSEGEFGAATDVIRAVVRPDIIVHNRNKSGLANNGLVVEVKKEYRAIMVDLAKLYYFTCQDKCTKFHYRVGAMVVLHPTYADICFICDKKILCRYKVCVHDIREMADDEKETRILPDRNFGRVSGLPFNADGSFGKA